MSILGRDYINFMPKGHYEYAAICVNMGFAPSPPIFRKIEKNAELAGLGPPYVCLILPILAKTKKQIKERHKYF